MRRARLWARLAGVEKAVVECVVFDDSEGAVVGGRWTWAGCGCSWRPTRRGCAVRGTGSWWRLRRIGIDEISWKKGHKYLTVVVCHDSGRLVRASSGRDRATLRAFFDALGTARSAQIIHISAGGRTGSPMSSPAAVRPRSCARTRSTSCPGPPTPSIRYAGRRGTSPATKRAAADGTCRARARPPSEPSARHARTLPVGAVEEPQQPHRATDRQAGLDRQDQPDALPRPPAQGRATGSAPDRQGQSGRRRGSPGPVDQLGPPQPDPGVRHPATPHHRSPCGDPGHHHRRVCPTAGSSRRTPKSG